MVLSLWRYVVTLGCEYFTDINYINKIYCLLSQFILISQRISAYSTQNRWKILNGVTGMVKMVTQDLHIPVTRQDRL